MFPLSKYGDMTSDQDSTWALIYPGDKFPEGAVRALNRGLDCHGEANAVDSYVALWMKSDADEQKEAVFGRAWNDGGLAKAEFTWAGEVHSEQDTGPISILTYIGPPSKNGFKYRWVRARDAKEEEVFRVGGYSPVVCVWDNGKEMLGKGVWLGEERWMWDSAQGKEATHQNQEFDQSYFLVKQKAEDEDCD